MRPFKTLVSALTAVLIVTMASDVRAQGNPTGTIAGRVTGQDGAALPGVSVTATSPNLQGARVVVTTESGDYIIPFLPPGEYTVSFELQGFKRAEPRTLVSAAGTITLDAKLQIEGVNESVTVTGSVVDAVSSGVTAATTMKQDLVDRLPLNRGLDATIALTPGVLRTGPSNSTTGNQQIAISGAITSENLVLVNGVVAQDNVRRTSVPLYIEDALQETTISTSGVSAEFGRFSGGVVNAITRSGGNSFSGTFRVGLTNDDWRTVTPFTGDTKADTVVPTYEYTVGGPVVRDRLWFFHAGRYQNETLGQTLFAPVRTPYERVTMRRRFEGKGTYSPINGHTARVAYLNNFARQTNGNFQNELDLVSLTNREDPEESWSVNYNAVLKSNLFIDAQYSRRDSSIVGAGAKATDLIEGTLVIDSLSGGRYNSATFCGVCRPEDRNNESMVVKATYFLARPGLGSHTMVAGYDGYNDKIAADSHQSGSGFRILGTTSVVRDGVVYPVWNASGSSTIIRWNPIFNPTQGSNFRTHALFFNDQWRVNNHLTLNLGVRYDRNDGVNSAGVKDVEGSRVSPRVGLTFDPRGDGDWIFNASYATYVSSIVNGIANVGSNAGGAAAFDFEYLGPPINVNTNAATLVTTHDALRILFDWFNANGGTNRPNVGAALPGVNRRVSEDLVSPSADEVAGGVAKRIGDRGVLRVDGVYRKFRDFYSTRVDTTTGQISNDLGQRFDLIVTENTNDVVREYAGLNISGSWRPGSRLLVGGGYTLSRTWGSIDGETSQSGPVTATPHNYPEYRSASWNYPVGDLSIDQRHKARVHATYTMSLSSFGDLTLGVLQSISSGSPYNAAGNIRIVPYVPANLGYLGAPTQILYFFSDRDAFRAEVLSSTDLAVNYDYRLPRAQGLRTFVKVEVLNLFDQSASINPFFVNQAVLTNVSSARYAAFNPFTETPVEGTHWDLGPTFGQATNRFAYQVPRTFRMSLGFRF
jgi:Carboxypeptidase regulatory-like domain/TonB dependent receptor